MSLTLDRARLDALARRSVQIISDNQAASGAYLAAPDFRFTASAGCATGPSSPMP